MLFHSVLQVEGKVLLRDWSWRIEVGLETLDLEEIAHEITTPSQDQANRLGSPFKELYGARARRFHNLLSKIVGL